MTDDIFYLTRELTSKQILELRSYLVKKYSKGVQRVKVLIHNTCESHESTGFLEATDLLVCSRSAVKIFPDIEVIAGPNISLSGYLVLCAGFKQTRLPHCSIWLPWNVIIVKLISEESGLPVPEVIEILKGGMPLNEYALKRLLPDANLYYGSVGLIMETMNNEFWAPTT